MDTATLTETLKSEATGLGFSLAGVCPAVTPEGATRLREWIDAGYAGQMHYFASRLEAYRHPDGVLAGARSLVMLALDYRTLEPVAPRPGQGRVSRYAWGADYHEVIHRRLDQLVARVGELCPEASARGVVDTAPLLEREFAELAGLGWVGKHTLLINKLRGSWFFLAALILDRDLVYDLPHGTDHCGTCRACIDACPTQAIVEPYLLDGRRCISYLTIELREPIPRELRAGMGEWAFGCDVCQDVCPWNGRAPEATTAEFQPRSEMNPLNLAELFCLDEAAFRARFKQTPLWRPRRRGILRNAAIVLGNQRNEAAIDALARGLADEEPLIRGACAWALGQIGTPVAKGLLAARQAIETDVQVSEEIALALAV
ncbi:MAG: tRNA epoxyqueuosine(34) reductase QueG [Planctomycetes bacterium]|nr:tRNA epoxyqueuosine(34) reductase QueG [Planctomycetota bacterium]